MYWKNLFLLVEKENLTDNRNLSGPPDIDSTYTINQILNYINLLITYPFQKRKVKYLSSSHRKNVTRTAKKIKTLTQP